jgi:hypothetical protein
MYGVAGVCGVKYRLLNDEKATQICTREEIHPVICEIINNDNKQTPRRCARRCVRGEEERGGVQLEYGIGNLHLLPDTTECFSDPSRARVGETNKASLGYMTEGHEWLKRKRVQK